MSRLGKARLPLLAALVCVLDVPAHAQRVDNAIAVFAALDKVTAAVKQLTVQLNQTGDFRTLKITPRACYTRGSSSSASAAGSSKRATRRCASRN